MKTLTLITVMAVASAAAITVSRVAHERTQRDALEAYMRYGAAIDASIRNGS